MLSNNNTKTTEPAIIEKKPDTFEVAEILLQDAQNALSKNEKGIALARYLAVLLIAQKFDDFTDEQKIKATAAIINSLSGIASINAESNLLDSLDENEIGNIGRAVFKVVKDNKFQEFSKSSSEMSYLLTSVLKNARILIEKETAKHDASFETKTAHAESTCGFFTKKALRATVIGVPLGIFSYSLYCAGILTAASTIAWGSLYGVVSMGAAMAIKGGYDIMQQRKPK